MNVLIKLNTLAKSATDKLLKKKESLSNDDLQKQAEAAHQDGIWSYLLEGNYEKVVSIIENNNSMAYTRGAMKELPLHLCFLYNSEKHFKIAKYLLEKFNDTILTIYESAEYYGENILHIAIVNKQLELIQYILEKDVRLLEGRATGDFFKVLSFQPYSFIFH